MDLNYQTSLLSYILQIAGSHRYLPHLKETQFELIEHKVILSLLQFYHSKYKDVPSKEIIYPMVENEVDGADDKLIKDIFTELDILYEPIPDSDVDYIRDTVQNIIRDSILDDNFYQYAEKKIDGKRLIQSIQNAQHLFVDDTDDVMMQQGSFLIADADKHDEDLVRGNPTYLEDLNKLTAAGGFYAPQLVIFMSAPKAFKTGMILKLAIEYMRSGLNVYYADAENGARDIRNRSKMSLMDCTQEELYDPDMIEEMGKVMIALKWMRAGDMFVDSYPANAKSISDVRHRLNYLKERFDFKPDLIVYDSIDHFLPSRPEDRKIDNRLKIGKVYHEAVALNRELDCFSFAPSQVNRNAVGKKTFDMRDIAEDFAKIANAHAVFAICSTPEEQEMGLRRLVPVVQRQGVRPGKNNFCLVQIDEATMRVDEVDKSSIAYEME